jgi:cytochrome oxidase Cu insertion factor (SCO1/SenC/PrrC family)
VSPKAKLLLLAAVCAAPVVLGTLVYVSGWTVGKPGNYGELLPPRLVAGAPLEALRGKWVLVTFDAAACDAYCEKKLYFMRQARRAQGKDMERVERLWVLTDGGKPRPEVLSGMEGTRLTDSRVEGFPGDTRDHIYIVDPLGNLMMRFPRDPDPSRIIKDLQRLLKLSRFG